LEAQKKMPGTKSDRATIEARRNRLIELLSEGKTASQAAVILRGEGFPASHDRVEADIDALLPALQKQNADDMSVYASNQYIELQALKLACHQGSIKPDRAIELLLAIMDREMRLLGTAAPTKSESKSLNVTVDGTGRFHRFIQAAAGLSDSQLEEVLRFASAMEREPLELPPGPPTLQLTEGE
jgi:hypothetical protein